MDTMRLIFFILGLALGGCSLLKDEIPPPPLKPVMQGDALKPGDALRITVAGEDELSGAFAVSSDGNIRMELLGAVKAAGLSPAGLEEDCASVWWRVTCAIPRCGWNMRRNSQWRRQGSS